MGIIGLRNVCRVKQLQDLALEQTQFTDDDLTALESLHKLESLTLWGSENVTSKGLFHLKNCNKLKRLRIGRTQVDDAGWPIICAFTDLRELGLGQLDISNQFIAKIVALTNLEKLDLTDCNKLGEDAWKVLPIFKKLTQLNLMGTAITDQGLKHLEQMTQLMELNILGTLSTAQGEKALKRALPRTKVVAAVR